MKSMPAEMVNPRFAFGSNWLRFLDHIDDERIRVAENSLKTFLMVNDLKDKCFLDVGSGSGLFSLAARRLGARVHSFDYDIESVACTTELKQRFLGEDPGWVVEQGSILDKEYIQSIGQFDVVYSWGVLHHTGAMWQALENVSHLVAERGKLFIAIYNDQGGASRRWTVIKRVYNRLPSWGRFLVLWPTFVRLWGPTLLRDMFVGDPFRTWTKYKTETRGMSPWRDVVDWAGGYPFEVAKPEEIFDFFRSKGFVLTKLRTCAGGHGCNEFVFINGQAT